MRFKIFQGDWNGLFLHAFPFLRTFFMDQSYNKKISWAWVASVPIPVKGFPHCSRAKIEARARNTLNFRAPKKRVRLLRRLKEARNKEDLIFLKLFWKGQSFLLFLLCPFCANQGKRYELFFVYLYVFWFGNSVSSNWWVVFLILITSQMYGFCMGERITLWLDHYPTLESNRRHW